MAGDLACPIADLLASGTLAINDGYRAKNSELATHGIPFARAGNIDGGFHFDDADCVPDETLSRVGVKVSEPGDVVFTSKGTVGRFAFVRDDTPRFVYSPQLCFWRVLDRNKIFARWLYYWMNSREFFLQFNGVAGQTDMAEYVSLRDQRAMRITLPPLPAQKRIAHILGTLDDKIELNRRTNATLEGISRAIFKSWFVDFDPVRQKAAGQQPVGMDAQTAALFPDSFEESEIGEVPKGWQVGRLNDLAEHPRRAVRPGEIPSGLPYIGLEHMPRRCIALSEWDAGDGVESNKFEFQRGEILFGKLRPYFHKVGVAPVDGICSTDIVVARPTRREWFGFVLGHMSSDEFVAYTNAASTGTKMPRTNWEDMSRYEAVLPPERVAEAFNDVVQGAVASITSRIHQSRTLAALRDTLLPKLLSGEIRVPEAEQAVDEAVR
jgi:type I restriction enzyme S subunit